MNSNRGIFIFTRNKPATLMQTADRIKNWAGNIFIIDDSTEQEHKQATQHISRMSGITYLGGSEFDSFCIRHDLIAYNTNFFLRRPGHQDWNLGYCRNFALLYAFSLKFQKVLFLDDDIIVPNLGIIHELLDEVDRYLFTGAFIGGLVDDSILGHLATDLGVINPRMLSGGFVAFNPLLITDYFMNKYNEDWIWLFLQLRGRDYLQKHEVIQELGNPFKNYKFKLDFQEDGEMLLDGILDLLPDVDVSVLVTLSLWTRMAVERLAYLNKLRELALKNRLDLYLNILDSVISSHSEIQPEKYQKLFIDYFFNKNIFHDIKKSLLGTSLSIA